MFKPYHRINYWLEGMFIWAWAPTQGVHIMPGISQQTWPCAEPMAPSLVPVAPADAAAGHVHLSTEGFNTAAGARVYLNTFEV